MLKSTPLNNQTFPNQRRQKSQDNQDKSKKIALMGRVSVGIINELYNPLDAINRFINLALQSIAEDSQSRQFLIESKKGIRKTSVLLKRLNNCVKRIEKETQELAAYE